jgi:hypothetical protein
MAPGAPAAAPMTQSGPATSVRSQPVGASSHAADGVRRHRLRTVSGWCAVSPLTTTLTAMIWPSGCRSSLRPSFPARGVEPQNDLDDRALPDRLRLLHRHLDGH